MIINLLYDKNNIIRFSPTDNISSVLGLNGFTTKTLNDVLSLRYTYAASAIDITVLSNSICKMSEINFDVVGTYNKLKIYTSIDYINWTELPYKTNGTHIFSYSQTVSGVDYYRNLSNGSILTDQEQLDDLNYIFKQYNTYSQEYDYLYENLEFQFIKFVFTDVEGTVENPLYFNNLDILISEELDDSYLRKSAISNRMSAWHYSKAFDQYNFLPDVLDVFAKMLETNNQEGVVREYEKVYLQRSDMDIIVFDPAEFTTPDSIVALYLPIGRGAIGISFRPR